MSDFENFKEELTGKEMLSSFLLDKKLLTKDINMFLMFEKKLR